MRHYGYIYEHGRNDVNGNPRHWVTVYRIKNNVPCLLGNRQDVGYRDTEQAVCDIVWDNEKSWQSIPNSHYSSGFNCNSVYEAMRRGRSNDPGVKVKLHCLGNIKVR